MEHDRKLRDFQAILGEKADLAFIPISADLEYLTRIPRDIPNFGRVMHPGAWLEGAWLTPTAAPVLALPRMTAEFGGLSRMSGIDLRVLGDWDDPSELVKTIIDSFNLPPKPRVAISDTTSGETIVALQALLPRAEFISATKLLHTMRVVKSEDEIAVMRRAGEITEAAFADVIRNLKHGMTELEVISEVDYQLKRHGSLGPSFVTSLYNSGPSHPLIFGDRLKTWPRTLTPPVTVLFDFGAIYQGYCYDFGRTVFFGEPDAEARRVHELVMASQAAGIAAMRADAATCEQVDAAARQVIEVAGYGKAFRHRLGHGIGVDVHEPPFLTDGDSTTIREGMMFTVEPSIMQFETFSARVEDVVVVRPAGGEPLTRGFQDLIVID
ncbi:MAG: M24 family metallopeptidase [Chloroflexota bacterium]